MPAISTTSSAAACFKAWAMASARSAPEVDLAQQLALSNGQSVAAGARLVVFASGKDRTNVVGRLHTSFALDADGAIWIANPVAPECARIGEGGAVLEVVSTGEMPCYACMLGGPEGRHLFMLCAPSRDSIVVLPDREQPMMKRDCGPAPVSASVARRPIADRRARDSFCTAEAMRASARRDVSTARFAATKYVHARSCAPTLCQAVASPNALAISNAAACMCGGF